MPIALSGLLAGCSANTTDLQGTTQSYSTPQSVSVLKPMTICSGFGCMFKDKFQFTEAEKSILIETMKNGQATAQAERETVALVIGDMENMTRRKLRFGQDVEKAYQRQLNKRGQMDCVDESLNTTAYLDYLYKNGLLKFHKPRKFYAERGLLIDGRYPHKSAVMIEKSGTLWSVDSWYGKGGEPARVMPLKDWRKVRDSFTSWSLQAVRLWALASRKNWYHSLIYKTKTPVGHGSNGRSIVGPVHLGGGLARDRQRQA